MTNNWHCVLEHLGGQRVPNIIGGGFLYNNSSTEVELGLKELDALLIAVVELTDC